MANKTELEKINNRSEFNKYNGIKIVDCEYGKTGVVEVELTNNSMNPWESAHGGLVYSMADVASGVAASDGINIYVTQSSSMYYFKPAKGKKLTCYGKVVKRGKTITVVETELYNEENVYIAKGVFEYFNTGMPMPESMR